MAKSAPKQNVHKPVTYICPIHGVYIPKCPTCDDLQDSHTARGIENPKVTGEN